MYLNLLKDSLIKKLRLILIIFLSMLSFVNVQGDPNNDKHYGLDPSIISSDGDISLPDLMNLTGLYNLNGYMLASDYRLNSTSLKIIQGLEEKKSSERYGLTSDNRAPYSMGTFLISGIVDNRNLPENFASSPIEFAQIARFNLSNSTDSLSGVYLGNLNKADLNKVFSIDFLLLRDNSLREEGIYLKPIASELKRLLDLKINSFIQTQITDFDLRDPEDIIRVEVLDAHAYIPKIPETGNFDIAPLVLKNTFDQSLREFNNMSALTIRISFGNKYRPHQKISATRLSARESAMQTAIYFFSEAINTLKVEGASNPFDRQIFENTIYNPLINSSYVNIANVVNLPAMRQFNDYMLSSDFDLTSGHVQTAYNVIRDLESIKSTRGYGATTDIRTPFSMGTYSISGIPDNRNLPERFETSSIDFAKIAEFKSSSSNLEGVYFGNLNRTGHQYPVSKNDLKEFSIDFLLVGDKHSKKELLLELASQLSTNLDSKMQAYIANYVNDFNPSDVHDNVTSVILEDSVYKRKNPVTGQFDSVPLVFVNAHDQTRVEAGNLYVTTIRIIFGNNHRPKRMVSAMDLEGRPALMQSAIYFFSKAIDDLKLEGGQNNPYGQAIFEQRTDQISPKILGANNSTSLNDDDANQSVTAGQCHEQVAAK